MKFKGVGSIVVFCVALLPFAYSTRAVGQNLDPSYLLATRR